MAIQLSTMIKIPCTLTAHRQFPSTGKVHHSRQCLAFSTHQTQCAPAGMEFDLLTARHILENKGLFVLNYHVRVSLKNVIRLVDLRRRCIVARRLLSQDMPITRTIIEICCKIPPQPVCHVNHCKSMTSKFGRNFDGVEPR